MLPGHPAWKKTHDCAYMTDVPRRHHGSTAVPRGHEDRASIFCGSCPGGYSPCFGDHWLIIWGDWVTDLLFHSVIKKQSSRKTQMHTSVCKKRPEGAEGLLGQASWWEGGRVGGRRAGPREVRPGDSEASPAAPSLEVWSRPGAGVHAFFQPDARLPPIGQNALQLCRIDGWRQTLAIRPARWLQARQDPPKFQFPHL